MSDDILPPRGVFVPTNLIYALNIPGPMLKTWIRLRGLAWRTGHTPPMTAEELRQYTGICPSALYDHMTFLRACGALRWRPLGDHKLIVTFDPADSNDGGNKSGPAASSAV